MGGGRESSGERIQLPPKVGETRGALVPLPSPTPDRPHLPAQPAARPRRPRRLAPRLGVSAPPCVAPSLGDTCRVGWGQAPAPLGSPPREAGGAFVSSRGMPGGGVRNGQRRDREVWDGVFHTPDGWARSAAVRTRHQSSLGEITNHKLGYPILAAVRGLLHRRHTHTTTKPPRT